MTFTPRFIESILAKQVCLLTSGSKLLACQHSGKNGITPRQSRIFPRFTLFCGNVRCKAFAIAVLHRIYQVRIKILHSKSAHQFYKCFYRSNRASIRYNRAGPTMPAMASRYNKKVNKGDKNDKNDKNGKRNEQPTRNRNANNGIIPRYRLWAKSTLAPYPAEDGNPLYSGDLEPEEFLAEKRMVQSLTSSNSEWLSRPGMAICLAAASLRAGSKEIIKGPPDAVKQLQLFLKNNPNFLEAIKTLDVGKSKVPDKKAIKKGVTNLVKGFTEASSESRNAFCKLTLHAAKLFLFGMHALETMELLRNPKIYAKKMSRLPKSKNTPMELEDWIKHPNDEARLKDMLSQALISKVKTHQKEARLTKHKRKREKSISTATKSRRSSPKSSTGSRKGSSTNCSVSSSSRKATSADDKSRKQSEDSANSTEEGGRTKKPKQNKRKNIRKKKEAALPASGAKDAKASRQTSFLRLYTYTHVCMLWSSLV